MPQNGATGGISGGDWLIGGATISLALVTAALVIVAYRQLSALRDESRRQRTYELYSRYYSEPFSACREAVRKALEEVEASTIGLMEASGRLFPKDQDAFDRYVNFMEEASQQYLAGLLDPGTAEEGLAYLAWFRWPQFKEYVRDQRAAQQTVRVCENWEDLHRKVGPMYLLDKNEAVNLARSWITALTAREWRLPDKEGKQHGPPFCPAGRLRRLVSKRTPFRVGSHWEAVPWSEAVRRIKADQRVLKAFSAPQTIYAEPVTANNEYVKCFTLDTSGENAVPPIGVVELRATRDGGRRHGRLARYVISGFAWYDSIDDATVGFEPIDD